MRVLIISQYFWPESFRINDLALGLKERGHDIEVLTGIPNYPSGKIFPGYGFFKKLNEDYHGVKVHRVPLIPRYNGKSWNLVLNYISFTLFSCFSVLFYLIRKYDLIFVCQYSPVTVGLPAVIIKKIKKTPILFWVQDLWPESLSATGAVKSSIILNIVRKFVCFIYNNCDRILIQSKAFLSYLKNEGIHETRICYFPNWAEELYQPILQEAEKLPTEINLPGGFRIMFAGNIGTAQDFRTILTAAELLRDNSKIHWLILGEGRMSKWVEEQISKRGLSEVFHMLGKHPVEEMPSYFSLADTMLVTLKREPIFALTIPSKVQSYLACGKPIIAALDGEGARIIEESGAGLVCPAEDPERLAQIVLEMYRKSHNERIEMGLLGRKYYETNFERKMLINHLENWMQEMVTIL